VPERLAQRLPHGLVVLAGGYRGRIGLAAQHEGEQGNGHDEHCQYEQRGLPAIGGDEALAQWCKQKLAKRTGRRRHPVADGAHVFRQETREGRQHHQKGRAGHAQPDQQAGGKLQLDRVARGGHQRQADRVNGGAADQYPRHAEPVCQHARDRLTRPPGETLKSDCQGEYLPVPTKLVRNGCQKQAHGGARPEVDHRNQAAGQDDQGHGLEERSSDGLFLFRQGSLFPISGGRSRARRGVLNTCVGPGPPLHLAPWHQHLAFCSFRAYIYVVAGFAGYFEANICSK